MPALIDPEHFLNLRLGLQHEVLGAAAAENDHRALATRGVRRPLPGHPVAALRAQDDRRGFVDILIRIDRARIAIERQRRHVHPDR